MNATHQARHKALFARTTTATLIQSVKMLEDLLVTGNASNEEIRARAKDNLQKVERELIRELEGLKTKEEKKGETEARLARVRAKLGK